MIIPRSGLYECRKSPCWDDSFESYANLSAIMNVTTDEGLNAFLEKNSDFSLEAGNCGTTPLAQAAKCGKVKLVGLILKKGEEQKKDLLYVTDDRTGMSPLHYACSTAQGFLAAKKLIQLKMPINIVRNIKGYPTPLETALESGCSKTAAMLLRLGGIFREEQMNEKSIITLKEAKMQIMNDAEKLLTMGMKDELNSDVIKSILLYSSMLI